MKNRESANKSRLRRKSQFKELTEQVKALTKERDQLQKELAATKAENGTLKDQNGFLRDLLKSFNGHSRASPSLPTLDNQTATTTITEAENGQEQVQSGWEMPTQAETREGRNVPVSGVILCGLVFGLTLFGNPYANENAVTTTSPSANGRRSMRILTAHTLTQSPLSFWDTLWVYFWNVYFEMAPTFKSLMLNALAITLVVIVWKLVQQGYQFWMKWKFKAWAMSSKAL